MHVVMWALVAVLTGLVAESVMTRGGHGRGWDVTLGLIGSVVASGIFQSQWVSPDPGLVAVTLVAAAGAAGLIAAQRKIWPAVASDRSHGPLPARRAGVRPTSRS